MIVHLTEQEAEYLRDKPFWDCKRAELDLMFENTWVFNTEEELEKAHKFHVEQEKFYRNLYKKLGGKVRKN